MPNILNENKGYPECVPCDRYEDKSIYIEDASAFLSAIDMRKVRGIVASQLEVVLKSANSSEVTAEELLNEVCKLKNFVQNYVVMDRLNSKEGK